MKCCSCKRTIASGAEAQKMILKYTQPDGTLKTFGYLMGDGPLSAATGVLYEAWHHKCFHITRKREARGDALTGRVITGGLAQQYDQAFSAAEAEAVLLGAHRREQWDQDELGRRVEHLRDLATRIGKPVGDPEVIEAFRAEDAGGPYGHTHRMPVEVYQLLAHLRYAHGHLDADEVLRRGAHRVHGELHAAAALQATTRQRDEDPGHTEVPERDWRTQHQAEI